MGAPFLGIVILFSFLCLMLVWRPVPELRLDLRKFCFFISSDLLGIGYEAISQLL